MLRRLTNLNLRSRLILASVLVETVMLTFLVYNSVRLAESQLMEQANLRVESVAPLLNAALLGPMMQRDFGTAQDVMIEAMSNHGFHYLILLDTRRRMIASVGNVKEADPPGLDFATRLGADTTLDMELAIGIGANHYGFLRYGVNLDFISQARHQLVRQGTLIASAGIAISILVLTLIGLWLTRRLVRLTMASQAYAKGDFSVDLPSPGGDEVGRLAEAFRDMATQLNSRLNELSESEKRLQAIAHHTYDMELWINPAGETVWVNPSVQRMIGFSPEDCLAMPDFPVCLIHEQDRPEATKRLQDSLGGSTGAGYQFRLVRRDGSSFWVSANWQPIFDRAGNELGVRASLRDITELKSAEKDMLDSLHRLQQSEQSARLYLSEAEQERARLRSLLSAMNLGILFVAENGQVIYCNPAFLHIWEIEDTVNLIGLSAREALARSTTDLLRPELFSKQMAELLDTHPMTESVEIPLRDGRLLTQVSYPVRETDGRFIGYLWVYEDITQERRTAQQLLNLAERDSLTGL